MQGSMQVINRVGGVRIHSYVAPADSFGVTTQLIETRNRVVAVDGQYALGYADEVVDYVRGLGKPLDRLMVTHAHPDHYQGAGRFGVPIHALDVVRDQIVAAGDKQDPSGDVVPVGSFTPTVSVTPGAEVIDGVEFVTAAVSGGEAPDQLVIRLPEQRVLIAQDLIYNRNHLFLGNNDVAGWYAAVEGLAADPDYDVILAGHGEPAGVDVYTEMTQYLAAARDLLGDDGDAYKRAIVERFPGYGGAFLIDIANLYLFPQEA